MVTVTIKQGLRSVVLDLSEDEATILLFSSRCDACGHLEALHNNHCCIFCKIPDYGCEDKELKEIGEGA